MVPVDRPGMDLDNPDQCPGRHPRTNVTLGLDRLALRVRGENEVHPLDADKEPPDRSLYHVPACPRRRHNTGRKGSARSARCAATPGSSQGNGSEQTTNPTCPISGHSDFALALHDRLSTA
jgi:hypothetical protein